MKECPHCGALLSVIHIYALVDPRDSKVRYVGRTEYRLEARLQQHVREAKATPYISVNKAQWIADLLSQNLTPRIELLEDVSFEKGEDAETEWIHKTIASGAVLTNNDAVAKRRLRR